MRIDFVDDGCWIRSSIWCLSHSWFIGSDGCTESVFVGDVLNDAENSKWIRVAAAFFFSFPISYKQPYGASCM